MGLFNLSRKTNKPYNDPALDKIYELLFCDNIDLYKTENQPLVYPFDILLANAPGIDKLNTIATDKTLESRLRILAYRLLAGNNSSVREKELLGVIVEVALPNGLDVLAVYSDGTARYINYSGKLLVWETQTEQSNALVKQLLDDSIHVVSKIGKWDKARLPFPTKEKVRLTFLVSDGLYFGEGPFEVLVKDAMGGPVINSAVQLMTYLTNFGTHS